MGGLNDNKVYASLCWFLYTRWHWPSFERTMAAWIPMIEKATHLYMLKTVLPLCMRYTYTSSTSSCFIMLKVKKYTPERGRYLSTFILTIVHWGLGDSGEICPMTSHFFCCYSTWYVGSSWPLFLWVSLYLLSPSNCFTYYWDFLSA